MGMTSGSGWVVELGRLMSDSVSGEWMKKRGMVVTPESTRPLTPILESSNCLTSVALSYDSVFAAIACTRGR